MSNYAEIMSPTLRIDDFLHFDLGKSELLVKPDYTNQTLKFEVSVPDNSWFAIGFGSTMANTDMIVWQASGK
jgi:hypothetical protein